MKKNRDRHSPNKFSSYQEIHETVIERYIAKGFVNKSNLVFDLHPYGFRLVGQLSCLGNIVLQVDKFLRSLHGFGGDAIVQTVWYTYHAVVKGQGSIFRYDNQDNEFLRVGHKDEHHKHLFNWATGIELPNSPVWVGYDGWLTLGEVLDELHVWYWDHRDDLPCPDCYPAISYRGRPPSLEL